MLDRYGAEDDIPPTNPLVNELNIPSRVLEKNNLEILITTLNTASGPNITADPSGLAEAILVPPLQTPVASSGRTGFVRYPVHKAIVVGEGIQGCLDFGRISAALEATTLGVSGGQQGLIQVVLSVPRDSPRTQTNDTGLIFSVRMSPTVPFLTQNGKPATFNPSSSSWLQILWILSLAMLWVSDQLLNHISALH